ncbi:GL20260 [Drosophila persimilis]|uniref:tRNA (guanine-N(7)-)-methyltransferase non-catalytic subunit wuho n=1 Tax=Drosophila persimilis TaxID=7234 RepID=WUHO_DROPE|nr:RecName: Full=tRNA (guanine-N(7)-)-methyltransferase non-catalytic subunit wuho [Drosophila persimilis]EDW27451.1 GL20260 [Drosophila persimilis]
MATIFFAEPELVIGHGRKVLFLNPGDLQIFKEIELPPDLTTCGLKTVEPVPAPGHPASSSKQQPAALKEATGSVKVEVSIQNVTYSPDRQLLALTTAGQKAVLLYKSRPENAQLLSIRPLARASSAPKVLQRWQLPFWSLTKREIAINTSVLRWMPRHVCFLGHLSIVYDVLWSEDQQYIITCDRDDKIRVTNYPATFDIHSYCLGHKEFVSGLAMLTEQHIISASGDKTLRVWNYTCGKELLLHELPAPAVRMLVRQLEPEKTYEVAVLFYDYVDAIGVYRLEQTTTESWSITSTQLVRAEAGTWNICNFALTDDRIYVTGAENERLTLRVYDSRNGERASGLPEGWLKMVLDNLDVAAFMPEDLSVWFKKRFDNVSDYLERKKRRIEEQKQQKCG